MAAAVDREKEELVKNMRGHLTTIAATTSSSQSEREGAFRIIMDLLPHLSKKKSALIQLGAVESLLSNLEKAADSSFIAADDRDGYYYNCLWILRRLSSAPEGPAAFQAADALRRLESFKTSSGYKSDLFDQISENVSKVKGVLASGPAVVPVGPVAPEGAGCRAGDAFGTSTVFESAASKGGATSIDWRVETQRILKRHDAGDFSVWGRPSHTETVLNDRCKSLDDCIENQRQMIVRDKKKEDSKSVAVYMDLLGLKGQRPATAEEALQHAQKVSATASASFG